MNCYSSIFLLGSACILYFCGCNQNKNDVDRQSNVIHQDTVELFGNDAERVHDFGTVIGSPGLKLTHKYPLKNTTNKPLRIIQAINQKPCCGEVELNSGIIQPGESVDLLVTIRVGENTIPLSHLAIVQTDSPQFPTREFFTFVKPHPRILIDQDSDAIPVIFPGETKRQQFTVRAFGNTETSPVDLNSIEIVSDEAIEWVEPVQEAQNKTGLLEFTRKFDLILKNNGKSGLRSTSINIKQEKNVLLGKNFEWEAASLLKTIPKVLFISMKDGNKSHKVSINAIDGNKFEIKKIQSSHANLTVPGPPKIKSASHEVNIEVGTISSSDKRAGTIEFETTHPHQAVFRLGIFITESTTPKNKEVEIP